jgi:7,8-dihydropterin-6-yl-methyl-4-(beta-D-ribofuranosyl)aminobenzene 5'-phosphate synthase
MMKVHYLSKSHLLMDGILMRLKPFSYFLIVVSLLNSSIQPGQPAGRITILVDAFGKPLRLKQDWGFSALVEYQGKRILFDAGNNTQLFEQNVKALGVDLKRLDFVVISHRHGDHTAGLHYLLRINPKVKIYSPDDEHFGGPTPGNFYLRKDESLPREMRYFGGNPPAEVPHSSAWGDTSFIRVNNTIALMSGIRLIPTVSQQPGSMELRELSMSIQTPKGQVLVVGCSHPGIETILDAVSTVDKPVHMIFGGLHLVTTSEPEIERLATALRKRWKVDQIGPGHCTGEPAFAVLRKVFGNDYIYAGLGTSVNLP